MGGSASYYYHRINPNPRPRTFAVCPVDHDGEKDAKSPQTKQAVAWDSRIIMVEEHLLGALLENAANLPPPRQHSAGEDTPGGAGSCSPNGRDGGVGGGGCEANARVGVSLMFSKLSLHDVLR